MKKDHRIYRLPKSAFLTLCFSLTAAVSLQAADITWEGADYDWTEGNNWSDGAVPTSSDNVILGTDGNKEIYIGGSDRTINFLTFDSEDSYTLNLQDPADPEADKDTRLQLYRINVEQGDHKIYGRPVTATGEGNAAESAAVIRQALRISTNADINDDEFVFDIAENASLDLDVRLSTYSKAEAVKRGEGTLIISLAQDGKGSVNFPHTRVYGLFEVQEGTLRIDATGAAGFSGNDWSVDGGTMELTKSFGGAGNHVTIKGAGYNSLGAIHASQSVTLGAGIVYINESAGVNVDAGKTLTLSGLVTDQRQFPDDNNKHTGLAAEGELVKTGAGILKLTRAAGSGYAGGTLIQAGTILVSNTSGSATGSGAVTIDGSNAGLGGTGAIGGELVVSNGWVSAGADGKDSYGKLTMADLSIESSGELFVDLQLGTTAAGSGYDQLVVGGAVSLGGVLNLNIDDSLVITYGEETLYGDIYFLIDNQGGASINGTFQGLSEGSVFNVDGYTFELTYLADASANGGDGAFTGGNDLALRMIPEPSALILAFLGCLFPLTIRRR